MAELPPPPEGIVLTHFIVSDDVERSRRFYTEVLGGRVERLGDPVNVALANSWVVINAGGGPTDDKPTVILETPRDPDRVSSFLLHPRSRRSPDRSGANHGPRGGLDARSLAVEYARREVRVNAEIELLSRPVDQDRLGGFRFGVLAGPFGQFPVHEGRSSAHQRDEVGCVDGAPAVLRRLDQLERHGQPGGPRPGTLGDLGPVPDRGEG